jgi:hypothetical protein
MEELSDKSSAFRRQLSSLPELDKGKFLESFVRDQQAFHRIYAEQGCEVLRPSESTACETRSNRAGFSPIGFETPILKPKSMSRLNAPSNHASPSRPMEEHSLKETQGGESFKKDIPKKRTVEPKQSSHVKSKVSNFNQQTRRATGQKRTFSRSSDDGAEYAARTFSLDRGDVTR